MSVETLPPPRSHGQNLAQATVVILCPGTICSHQHVPMCVTFLIAGKFWKAGTWQHSIVSSNTTLLMLAVLTSSLSYLVREPIVPTFRSPPLRQSLIIDLIITEPRRASSTLRRRRGAHRHPHLFSLHDRQQRTHPTAMAALTNPRRHRHPSVPPRHAPPSGSAPPRSRAAPTCPVGAWVGVRRDTVRGSCAVQNV